MALLAPRIEGAGSKQPARQPATAATAAAPLRLEGASVSNATHTRTIVGAGSGKGGAGGAKVCRPCTCMAMGWTQPMSTTAWGNARTRAEAGKLVKITNTHKLQCRYCKCPKCMKDWSQGTFTLKTACSTPN